jgi:cell wall-associated NlpC family hydrolase
MFSTARLFLTALALAAFPSSSQAMTIARARDRVVALTMPYLNIPYLWGGTSPRTGLDCSAFVQLVYRKAGFNLPRVSRQQFAATRYLPPRRVLPGDLIFFSMHHPQRRVVDHVGIYLGKGYFIHASVSEGVHIQSILDPYYIKRLVSIRKYAGF